MINQNLLLTGDDGYNLTKSLRFRSSASVYLDRTPASAGNRRTWTWSGWVKRGALGVYSPLFIAGTTNGQQVGSLAFSSAGGVYDKLELNFGIQGTSTEFWLQTTQVFRDPSAWYHIVCAVDTTQATSSNRVKFYVNGAQVTALSSYGGYNQYPSQNYDTSVNNTVQHLVSRDAVNTAGYFDGYLTEVNFIDGQALTPSSFGETSTSTGVWIPKKYTGTYGTNGFYLPFTDTTSTSTLGTDFSGNSNTWTVNNISLTSGSTYDSMTDVPTLTSATTANYCVLNPLRSYSANTVSNGNLNILFTDPSSSRTTYSTFGVTSGKWYFEMTVTATGGGYYPGLGVNTDLSFAPSGQSGDTASGYMYLSTGQKFSATLSAYGSSYTTNDVIGVALDMDGGTITFYKNNTSQGQAFSGITGTAVPCFIGNASSSCAVNFGQRPFAYTPPTGFVALNTFNLPTPTIGATASTVANKYFNSVIWTGDQTNKQIPLNFTADFVWAKRRSGADSHRLYDVIRGINKDLQSNSTDSEQTNDFGLDFDNGNYLAIDGTKYFGGGGGSGITFVAWNWKANGTGVTNTAGSITSTVSANTTAGFSIVTYTGTGANATVGHGLGVAPSMIIIKNRSTVTDWAVYHSSNTASPATQRLLLNTTDSTATSSVYWNNTAPTSSVFSISTYTGVNNSSHNLVAYCFAPVAGYSAFGSYTGNGSTDGPFIFTGFRPRFVMTKKSSSTGGWGMVDTSINPYNQATTYLQANTSNATVGGTSANGLDFVSNGFKIRSTDASFNETNGDTYIYMAFAESPFRYANAR